MSPNAPTISIHELLDRWHQGDAAALDELFRHSQARLLGLTRGMMNHFSRIRAWLESGDVLHEAEIRLLTALQTQRPRSEREFLGLAARQIAWELQSTVRQLYGPNGIGARLVGPAGIDGSAAELAPAADGPEQMAAVNEFFRALSELPPPQREAIELRHFSDYSYEEAARVMGLTRYAYEQLLLKARLALAQLYGGDWPF